MLTIRVIVLNNLSTNRYTLTKQLRSAYPEFKIRFSASDLNKVVCWSNNMHNGTYMARFVQHCEYRIASSWDCCHFKCCEFYSCTWKLIF